MVHGTRSKRFKRVKLTDSRSLSTGSIQPSIRTQEPINPFLYAPEEFAQQRRRHGGHLISPSHFVPLDSARIRRSSAMKLRKKQLSRATAEAERNAQIAKALSKAIRRERRTKSTVKSLDGSSGGMGDSSVAVRHIVNVSDVIFASPEAAQLLCGEDVEWVDDDDSTTVSAEEFARKRRKNILRHRSDFFASRSSVHSRLKTVQKSRK